jgi:hypothetical protein
MKLTYYKTSDYVNNLRLLKMKKQTQSNPIYGERSRTTRGEPVEPFRPFEIFAEIRSRITFKSLL